MLGYKDAAVSSCNESSFHEKVCRSTKACYSTKYTRASCIILCWEALHLSNTTVESHLLHYGVLSSNRFSTCARWSSALYIFILILKYWWFYASSRLAKQFLRSKTWSVTVMTYILANWCCGRVLHRDSVNAIWISKWDLRWNWSVVEFLASMDNID